MNTKFEDELRYHLLKILENEPNISQRKMAGKMGISLGKVNYCLTELAKKGFIKVNRFKSAKNKMPYTYLLTLRGMEEKSKLTINFLKRKLREYEEIKRQIGELNREVEENQISEIRDQ
ncbi:MarR family EPS-associated transcriptional regulator [Thermodesulfobacteriota bacterium]